MLTSMRRMLAGLLLAGGLAACAAQQEAAAPAGPPQPANPQPTATQLSPGLTPLYFIATLDHVDNMPRNAAELAKGRRGPAILQLDVESGSGRMWDSQAAEGFAVHMTGLIQLEAGIYRFAAFSNDGIRITIDRTRVVDDPSVHAGQMSPVTEVRISEPAWYPITVQYFQKRGTAALKFYWQPPGAGGLMLVPAAALAHLPAR
ncbi:MAG: PA14 domain-containing protein [Ferrovibrio sp.]|uniref:PA14 domain-containing protein n=1 Tax=Ferrovibrio sp. TaxID=1917215 RepID=UPI00391BA16D